MNTDQFCNWLKGYLESHQSITPEQVKTIKQRLNMSLSDRLEFIPHGYPHHLIENAKV